MSLQDPPCASAIEDQATRSWHPWYWAALLLLLSIRFMLFAIAMGHLLPVRSDLTFPEGAVVSGALDVARGASAYHDWRDWPHVFAPYGPLTYYPVGWLARLVTDARDPWDIYLLGRIQSYLGILIIAGSAMAIGRSLRLGWGWCVAIVGLFCVWEQVFSYVASYRPDAPQVACSLLALSIMLRRKPTTASILLVLGILSCAMWFKPSAWGMIVFAGIWLWSAGSRRAIATLVIFGGANLAVALLANSVLDGRLLLNMVGSLDNGIVWINVPGFYAQLPLEAVAVFIIGGLSLRHLLRVGQSSQGTFISDCPGKALAVATSASWAVTTLMNFKEGADVNYYLETYVLLCILCVWGARAFITFHCAGREWLRILAASGVLLWASWSLFSAVNGYPDFLKSLKTSWSKMGVEDFVQRAYPGPIYTTNPFLALARADYPSMIDHFQFGVLVGRGKLDPRGLLGRIQREEFELIVISSGDWREPREGFICDGFVPLLKAHYYLDGPIGGLVALRPNRGRSARK